MLPCSWSCLVALLRNNDCHSRALMLSFSCWWLWIRIRASTRARLLPTHHIWDTVASRIGVGCSAESVNREEGCYGKLEPSDNWKIVKFKLNHSSSSYALVQISRNGTGGSYTMSFSSHFTRYPVRGIHEVYTRRWASKTGLCIL